MGVERADEGGGVGGEIRDLEVTGPPPHHGGSCRSRSAARQEGDGRPQRVGRAAREAARVLQGLPQDLPGSVRELRIRVKDRAHRAARGLLGLRHRFLPLYDHSPLGPAPPVPAATARSRTDASVRATVRDRLLAPRRLDLGVLHAGPGPPRRGGVLAVRWPGRGWQRR